MISRRQVILAAATSPLLWAMFAVAQQPKQWRLGFLGIRPRPADLESDVNYGGLFRKLRELGYVEGRNLVLEWRAADGTLPGYRSAAADLVQHHVDAIVTTGDLAARGAQQASKSVPIVGGALPDPVAAGLVDSLLRPGGNLTGASIQQPAIAPKLIEILRVSGES